MAAEFLNSDPCPVVQTTSKCEPEERNLIRIRVLSNSGYESGSKTLLFIGYMLESQYLFLSHTTYTPLLLN